jgi:GTP:adenosylcobinamide-phosphate guanylyltransferase
MVYIGEGYRGDLHALISSLEHRPILVVTDEVNALGSGSMVNFVIAEGKVRFEVSLASATRAGLKISSQLLAVAVRVQTG